MPHILGPELGHCIRAMELTIPIYFVSGHLENEYAEQLKKIGNCRDFTKSINTSDFLQSLKTDLGMKG
jgi:FixJ family two-component response regulator